MPAKKRCQYAIGSPDHCNQAALRMIGSCPHCNAHFCGSVSDYRRRCDQDSTLTDGPSTACLSITPAISSRAAGSRHSTGTRRSWRASGRSHPRWPQRKAAVAACAPRALHAPAPFDHPLAPSTHPPFTSSTHVRHYIPYSRARAWAPTSPLRSSRRYDSVSIHVLPAPAPHIPACAPTHTTALRAILRLSFTAGLVTYGRTPLHPIYNVTGLYVP